MRQKHFGVALTILTAFGIMLFAWGFFIWNKPLAEDIKLAPPETSFTLSTPLISGSDPIKGSSNAPVTIIEFSDFLCPFCVSASQTVNQIISDNKNNVRVIWKDLPNVKLHPLALNAALAGRCAFSQGKFWEYHDLLFANQESITSKDVFLAYAEQLGLDSARFSQCTASAETKLAVDLTIAEAMALGVDGTPYFFVGKERGTFTREKLESIIETSLANNPNKP